MCVASSVNCIIFPLLTMRCTSSHFSSGEKSGRRSRRKKVLSKTVTSCTWIVLSLTYNLLITIHTLYFSASISKLSGHFSNDSSNALIREARPEIRYNPLFSVLIKLLKNIVTLSRYMVGASSISWVNLQLAYNIVRKSKLLKQVGRGSGSKFECALWGFTRAKIRNAI